jgi:hypothetical protein
MGLRMHRQVGALRKVLSQQAVGILVRPALPRALRITKIDVDFGRQRKATMIRKFLSCFRIVAKSGSLLGAISLISMRDRRSTFRSQMPFKRSLLRIIARMPELACRIAAPGCYFQRMRYMLCQKLSSAG